MPVRRIKFNKNYFASFVDDFHGNEDYFFYGVTTTIFCAISCMYIEIRTQAGNDNRYSYFIYHVNQFVFIQSINTTWYKIETGFFWWCTRSWQKLLYWFNQNWISCDENSKGDAEMRYTNLLSYFNYHHCSSFLTSNFV